MHRFLVSLLRCPDDEGPLRVPDGDQETDAEVLEGHLLCAGCGRSYPIQQAIPRFVDGPAYAASFGFEWERHARTAFVVDEAGTRSVFDRLGFTADHLRGTLVLDAGCGAGRFSRELLRRGAQVVAVDLSRSVERAAMNLLGSAQVDFVQADLARLPFDAVFDHIVSLGVLHHTPDPAAAFAALTRHLRPGGSITITVYPQGGGLYEFCKRWRRHTTRMRSEHLYRLTSLAARFLYPIYRLPVFQLFYPYLPISMHPDLEWRRLDTFDAYSPQYASTHSYHEVFTWFREAGLVEIEVLPTPVSMRGWKPNVRNLRDLGT